MKKVLLKLLAVILIVVALGAAGMTGYRYGYAQALSAGSNDEVPALRPGFGMGPQRMPMHNFGFDRDFDRGGFPMMRRGGMGFGFFSPLWFLLRIAFWGLVIWVIYMLVARSGWRLTRTAPVTEVQPTPPATDTTPEMKE